MKRIFGHVVSLLVVGLAVSSVLPACATNDQSIFIKNALAPSLTRTNGICSYTGDPTQPALFQAQLDVGLADEYFAVLLVGSQLTPRADPQANRAESNRIHINGAIVRVTETDGTLIREFTSLATGFADPGNNAQASFGAIGVTGIDAPTKAILVPTLPNRQASRTILMNFKAFGTTLGGQDVESGEYQLPARVCNGCLVDFTDANDDTAPVQPNCLKKTTTAGGTGMRPCVQGQDELVQCSSCVGTRKVCDPLTL